MSYPVLILTMNNLELTKKCVESVRAQDIPTSIFLIDNGSTDGTTSWALNEGLLMRTEGHNAGVSHGWNWGLDSLFRKRSDYSIPADHVLVLNNDVELPPWFYSELLSFDVPFVTGVAVDERPTEHPQKMPLNPHPDFSAFLIHRSAWERIGPFDETMKIYASDCDYHLRGFRLDIPMMKANVPYFHINSQTLKRANEADRAAIEAQAQKDREIFRLRWGVWPGSDAYNDLFQEVSRG